MLLDWYERRYTRVFPEQLKLAAALKIKVRQLRNYLSTLRRLGIVSTHQGGDGRAASYALNFGALVSVDYRADCRADCQADCRAEIQGPHANLSVSQQVAGENCQAEREQLKSSSCSLSSFDQSERTVQEHQEPAGAATDLLPFEKAQADAIAEAVRACGFEPTPDLIAKLERKRRHYGVTGFKVASAIARAFKLVEGTSNQPRTLAWFTTVVENALKQHGTAGATAITIRTAEQEHAHRHASQTPIPDKVADVDQASGTAVDNPRAAEPSPTSPPAEVCRRCGSDGVVNGTAPAIWCDCERGRQKRRARSDYVDVLNRSAWRTGAIAAAAQPRPPQSERGALAEILPAEALGALG
jgi:hypothetical protein